jgi:hypothetical protein
MSNELTVILSYQPSKSVEYFNIYCENRQQYLSDAWNVGFNVIELSELNEIMGKEFVNQAESEIRQVIFILLIVCVRPEEEGRFLIEYYFK